MRKNLFLFILLMAGLCAGLSASALAETEADWAWLVAQVAEGKETIALPKDIVFEGEEGLRAEGTVRIDGNGFGLTGAVLDGGTFIFRDVRLSGEHGVGDESGGAALLLRGEGTIAVLMGATRAEGGRSGDAGETGGDGVRMAGDKQGLILNNTATAVGGVGCIHGGAGVRVEGCAASVLATDSASMQASPGLIEGGAGVRAPACAKLTFSEQASVTGGASQHTGGHGVASVLCASCQERAPVSLSGMAMAIGSAGQDGGHGVLLVRAALGDAPDLVLADTCMLIGGDGGRAGAALYAEGATIDIDGTPVAFGGQYYTQERAALTWTDCVFTGDEEALAVTEGGQSKAYPASEVPAIIHAALSRQSERNVPKTIEDGLSAMELDTKLDGLTVERGSVSQAGVNGGGLKIFMHNGTLEKRLKFQQRLMSDGGEGARLVLIASVSEEWPTMESTVAALRKLESLGVTQIAYTCVAPTYNERVLDIAALLEAIDAQEEEYPRILAGTADDAIIFLTEKGERRYQEELMGEVARPVK